MKKIIYIFCCVASLLLISCAAKVAPDATPGFAKQNAPAELSAEQIFANGAKALSRNNFKDAIKSFEELDAKYPFDKLVQKGQMYTIYAYYKDAEYESAIAAADRYIHLYPRHEHTDYALYMKGVINFERGKNWLQKVYPVHMEQIDLTYTHQAFINFNDLIKFFPDSIYVSDARQRMIYIRDLIAKRELETAQFYFERKAYIAAVNRSIDIVKHYQGSPQVKGALEILVKSYHGLGDETQAKEVQKILDMNFLAKK